jgi:hypothetical protein
VVVDEKPAKQGTEPKVEDFYGLDVLFVLLKKK